MWRVEIRFEHVHLRAKIVHRIHRAFEWIRAKQVDDVHLTIDDARQEPRAQRVDRQRLIAQCLTVDFSILQREDLVAEAAA